MNQTSSIRKLESILRKIVEDCDSEQIMGKLILEVMGLAANEPNNLFVFFDILSNAKEEAVRLKTVTRLDESVAVIKDLQDQFLTKPVWTTQAKNFVSYIKPRNILTVLNNLADALHKENPQKYLDQEFLDGLKDQLGLILDEIYESELSKDLKSFLMSKIEEILIAIKRYPIDGTEGIRKAAGSTLGELAVLDKTIEVDDRRNHVWKKVGLYVGRLFVELISPAYLIAFWPDLDEYYIPRIEDFIQDIQQAESFIQRDASIDEIIRISVEEFTKAKPLQITGTPEPKYLFGSRDESEIDDDNVDQPEDG